MLQTGYLYKMGNGPINLDWNQRYFVLDKENKKLSYFLKETDRKARGLIELSNAIVTNAMPIKGRKHSFGIKLNQGKGKEFNLSAHDSDTANSWISMINSCIKNENKFVEVQEEIVQNYTVDQDDELKDKDIDQKYPNIKDVFEKF